MFIHSKYGTAPAHVPVSEHPPRPHGIFWRQTGDYERDYTAFTTGDLQNVGIPIMNTSTGQELTSNFCVVLLDEGIEQMPEDGPFITDAGFKVSVEGLDVTGAEIVAALKSWLTNGSPK